MILFGPEFQRNIWLKFSWFRTLAMPTLVGLIALIGMNTGDDWTKSLTFFSLIGFFITVILWGNYEAASSIRDELKSNTWDFQKMSAIGPWHLLFGKLFGATSYVWYFGVALLAMLCIAYMNYEFDPTRIFRGARYKHLVFEQKTISPPFRDIYFVISTLVLAGLIGHATAIYSSLLNIRYKKSNLITPLIAGLIASSAIFKIALAPMDLRHFQKYFENTGTWAWYGYEFNSQFLTQFILLFLLYWLLAGIYRTIREELHFRMTPIVWGMFVISVAVFIAGFVPEPFAALERKLIEGTAALFAQLLTSYAVILLLTYMVVVYEAANFAGYKRFYNSIREKSIKRSLESCPKWVASCLILLGSYIAVIFWIYSNDISPDYAVRIIYFLTAAALFVARDGLVMHTIMIGRAPKHAQFLIIVYYAIAYVIFPWAAFILTDTSLNLNVSKILRTGDAGYLMPYWDYFFPGLRDSFVRGVLPVLIEVIIASGLLVYKIRILKIKKG